MSVKPVIVAKFYAFAALQLKSPFFCDVASSHWVIGAPRFETASWPHLRGARRHIPEERGPK